MNLVDLKTIKTILRQNNVRAKKSWGQHFLICSRVLEKIIEVSNLSPNDLVLEIGPGLGTLTRKLCPKAGKVFAYEVDAKMVKILNSTCGGFKNLKIINQDVLKISIPFSQFQNYKVIANLPYQITFPILEKFLQSSNKPLSMVLMVQREVAERICARPSKMNLLAVLVQFYGRPQIVEFVSKECFWPRPEVDSAIIKISSISDSRIQKLHLNEKLFFGLVKAVFSNKRKMLKNSLSGGLSFSSQEAAQILREANINPTLRAENLEISDWLRLYNKIKGRKM